MHKLFESQLDNEKIYLVVREHPALLAFRLALLGFLTIVGIIAHAIIPDLLGDLLTGTGQFAFSLLFYTYYLVLLIGLLFICSFYYLSLQIITDMRMVDVDQAGLFRRKVTEIQIENVEEVTSTAHGLLSTVFNFGNVLVQTSSAQNEFEFENVAKAEQVKKLILDLYEQRRKNHNTPHIPQSKI
ncbi:MAG: PH domain-containing protein [Candidatus Doudnabacteria bacterium]|nr:PH domain-containing protein [Candidatus Doudnabacteria bacterium]